MNEVIKSNIMNHERGKNNFKKNTYVGKKKLINFSRDSILVYFRVKRMSPWHVIETLRNYDEFIRVEIPEQSLHINNSREKLFTQTKNIYSEIIKCNTQLKILIASVLVREKKWVKLTQYSLNICLLKNTRIS